MWRALVLALGLFVGLAAVVLASWMTAEVEVAAGDGPARLAVVVSFWRWRRTRSWNLLFKPSPGGSGGPPEWGAVVRGVRIYLRVLHAVAARADIRLLSLQGDFSTGDPALTAWIYGAASAWWAARFGATDGGDRLFGVQPRWSGAGWRITGRGIFRWRVAHIITAAWASLLGDEALRPRRQAAQTGNQPGGA
jgi:hypothetical protein